MPILIPNGLVNQKCTVIIYLNANKIFYLANNILSKTEYFETGKIGFNDIIMNHL